jgi:phosphoribosylglycinamide formyltransferase-1
MSLKIGVLASHGGSNMQAIIDRIEAGTLDAQVVLIVSNNSGSGAIERAKRHDLPWRHLSGRTHPGEGALDLALHDAMVAAGAEVIVLAGYMKKIGTKTLRTFQGRILNIHPALLPKHGGQGMYGIHPHESVLAAGDEESGATVHAVDEHYDHGPVLRQRKVPVLPGDTPETLQRRVLAEEHVIYAEVLADIVAGKITLPVASA